MKFYTILHVYEIGLLFPKLYFSHLQICSQSLYDVNGPNFGSTYMQHIFILFYTTFKRQCREIFYFGLSDYQIGAISSFFENSRRCSQLHVYR
jgi:hypothetical protein